MIFLFFDLLSGRLWSSDITRVYMKGFSMGYPTKVQLIDRKDSRQWYINFPSAIAQAMEFEKGEVVEWVIQDKAHLVLRRMSKAALPAALKKTTHRS